MYIRYCFTHHQLQYTDYCDTRQYMSICLHLHYVYNRYRKWFYQNKPKNCSHQLG